MGHFLPMINIAEELSERGHDVTVLTNQYNEEKCRKIIEQAGCTAVITQDGVSREEMCPNDKTCRGGYVGFKKWMPILKEEIHNVKPDVAVVDFFTVPAFKACDELGIKVVSKLHVSSRVAKSLWSTSFSLVEKHFYLLRLPLLR